MAQIGGFVPAAQGGQKAAAIPKKSKIPREAPGGENCVRRARRKQISLPLLSGLRYTTFSA